MSCRSGTFLATTFSLDKAPLGIITTQDILTLAGFSSEALAFWLHHRGVNNESRDNLTSLQNLNMTYMKQITMGLTVEADMQEAAGR